MKLLGCTINVGDINCAWANESFTNKLITIPREIKKRLNTLGKFVIERLFFSVLALNGTKDIAWVVSCRHGDLSRIEQLMTNFINKEMLSPIDFSMSVHNAIIGMFSIATNNKNNHIALAAGNTSFTQGLIEAYALQQVTNDVVGYVYYDYILAGKYNGPVKESRAAKCIILLLGSSSDKAECMKTKENIINLAYFQETEQKSQHNVELALVDFLQTTAQEFNIFVPGGRICFTKH